MDSERRTLEVNIVNLCCKLISTASVYYEENKEKFDFFQYDLQDRRRGKMDILRGFSLSESDKDE